MDIVRLLEWDTKFFGFPVAQIKTDTLNVIGVEQAFRFCNENDVRLLQFKCDAHHRASILLAENHNFHFADVRITLEKKLTELDKHIPTLPAGVSFRIGVSSDTCALKEIVTDLYAHSRYYFDTNFPRDDVHGFYRNWIEKSLHGQFDDCVWVLCVGDTSVGCCSISYRSSLVPTIGLFGIDPCMSGQGFGIILLQQVLKSIFNSGFKRVSVVTQGRNYHAQRLYQRAGFQSKKMEIYYHRWFDSEEAKKL